MLAPEARNSLEDTLNRLLPVLTLQASPPVSQQANADLAPPILISCDLLVGAFAESEFELACRRRITSNRASKTGPLDICRRTTKAVQSSQNSKDQVSTCPDVSLQQPRSSMLVTT